MRWKHLKQGPPCHCNLGAEIPEVTGTDQFTKASWLDSTYELSASMSWHHVSEQSGPLGQFQSMFPGQSNIPIFYICGEAKILFYSLERKQLNVVNTANSSMNRNCYQQRASEKCALDRNISNESTGFPQVAFFLQQNISKNQYFKCA